MNDAMYKVCVMSNLPNFSLKAFRVSCQCFCSTRTDAALSDQEIASEVM
jgi:hypothetical protein